MSKQDRQGVRTATDLERKYTLGAIRKIEGAVDVHGSTLNKVEGNIVKHTSDIEYVNKELAVALATVNLANESSKKAVSMAEKSTSAVNTMKQDMKVSDGKIAKNTEDIANLKKTIEDEYATTQYVDNAVRNAGGGGGGTIPNLADFLGYEPSFIKVYRPTKLTSLSASYNYFGVLSADSVTDVQKGNLTFTTKTLATFGDRRNAEIPGVLVGANVHQVKVTGSACYKNNDSSTSMFGMQVLKVRGETITCEDSERCRLLETETRTLSVSTIINVSEGDFVCLQSYKGVKSIDVEVLCSSLDNSKATQMCVEAIG